MFPDDDLTADEQQWAALAAYVDRALDGQDPGVAEDLRRQFERGQFRVIGTVDLDETGQPDPTSLYYRVDVPVMDGWAPVVRVHWTRLPMTLDQVRTECVSLTAQREMGITPDAWDRA